MSAHESHAIQKARVQIGGGGSERPKRKEGKHINRHIHTTAIVLIIVFDQLFIVI